MIAFGIVPHTGWAWLVRVSGPPARVDSRGSVLACQVTDGELYHRAAKVAGDRTHFLEAERAAAVSQASRSLAPVLAGAGAAVVVGKRGPALPLERIIASHALIHGAEGELWRAIFAEACAASGMVVTRATAIEVRQALARRHGDADIDAFLATARRAMGAPWGRELQEAALAGWSAV